MRALGLPVACTILLATLPGASNADTHPTPTTLLIGDTDHAVLELQGNGWARVLIEPTTDTRVSLTVRHDAIDDLCSFSKAGDGLYDRGHVTGFLLWEAGPNPWSGDFFTWHGMAASSVWPIQSGRCGSGSGLPVEAGDVLELIIADTVGGYTLHIAGDRGQAPTQHHTIPLVHNPAFVRIEGDPEGQELLDERGLVVQDRRGWTAPLTLPQSAPQLAVWDIRAATDPEGPQGHVSSTYQDMWIERQNADDPLVSEPPTGSLSYGVDNSTGVRRALTILPTVPSADYLIQYRLERTSLTLGQTHEFGGYFVNYPLELD